MPGPFGALCHVNLLHNNEVRNVTNQNTRQHRDKVLRFLLSSFFLLLFIIIIFYIWGRNVRNSSCICQPQRNWNVCAFIAADVCRLSSNAMRGGEVGDAGFGVGIFRVWWEKNMSEIEAGQQEVIYNKYDTITYHISYHIVLILLPH